MKKLVLLTIISLVFCNIPLIARADTTLASTNISEDTIWTKDNGPYFLNGNVTIQSGATLTIEKGTEVRIASGRKIDVYGGLKVEGDDIQNVLFTAQEDDGVNTFPTQSGRWSGIVFRSGSTGNISGATLRFAGYEIFGDAGGPAISNIGGEVVISSSTLTHSTYATRLKAGKTTITNSEASSNTQGVYLEGGELYVSKSTIKDSQDQSLIAFGSVQNLELNYVIFENNKNNISLEVGIPHIISHVTFTGGKYAGVYLSGATVGSQTLSSTTSYVLGNISVSQNDTLTLPAGVVLKGGSIDVYGALIAEGTKDQPVVYTSLADDSVSGDTEGNGATDLNSSKTGGILVHSTGSLDSKYLEIRYAGLSQFLGPFNFGYAALTNLGGKIFANHLRVNTLNGSGIHHESGSTTIISTEVSGSYDNSIVFKEGNLYVSNTAFTPGYANLSLRNKSPDGKDVPDLRWNYWGTEEGPRHTVYNATGTAALIEGEALFIPFLTSLDQITKDPELATTTPEISPKEETTGTTDQNDGNVEEENSTSLSGSRRHNVESGGGGIVFPVVIYEIMPEPKPVSRLQGQVLGASLKVASIETSTTSEVKEEKTSEVPAAPLLSELANPNANLAAVSVSWQDDYTELRYLAYFGLGLLLLLILVGLSRRRHNN